ncbi:MAG: YigZ family protein [Arcobacteraceae bacterium]|nr:YigZ family protein [Arcobacteraceae bacterium]
MQFVQKEYNVTVEIKKSKFITYLFPYEKFNDVMEKLKNEHPKARHFVYAYRYLNEFEQIVENSSDDGEPKGTSGKPSLAVMAGMDIINSGVIIVRYFGGIKLGTGGLIRAYGDAVNEVLNSATLVEYKKLIEKKLIFEYSYLSKVEYLLEKYDIIIVKKVFEIDVVFFIQASKEQLEKLKLELDRKCIIEETKFEKK